MDVEKVSKAIAFLRKRTGYTQKELAERLGVSDKAVSKWERGLGLPDISCLRKLSVLLDTDTDSLLAGDVIHHGSGWRGLLLLDRTSSGVGLHTRVYDKPMVYYLLSYFLLMGIREVLIVCTKEEIDFARGEFGDGSDLGIRLLYSDSGAEQAIAAYSEFMDGGNFMVVYGRSFIYGVDQTRFFQRAMIHKDRLTVLSLPRGRKPQREKLMFDDDKKIVCEGGSEDVRTQYDYYDIPVLFCPKTLLQAVCRVINSGSVAEDPELKDRYMYTEVLDRGFVEIGMDTWEQVLGVASFVKIVEQACGMSLYCIEEIAWRRGMISTQKLKELAEKKTDLTYQKYLLGLCQVASK